VRVAWFSPIVMKNHAVPLWGGEKNWKKKAKLMGQDKDSLAEQQRENKITAINTDKKIMQK